MSVRTAWFATLLLLAFTQVAAAREAQAPGPPWPILWSPTQITYRWYADEMTAGQVLPAAHGYCASAGRTARVGSLDRHGDIEIGSYLCR